MKRNHSKTIAYAILIATAVTYAAYAMVIVSFPSSAISFFRSRLFFDSQVELDDDAEVYRPIGCPGPSALSGAARMGPRSEAYRKQYVEYPCEDIENLPSIKEVRDSAKK